MIVRHNGAQYPCGTVHMTLGGLKTTRTVIVDVQSVGQIFFGNCDVQISWSVYEFADFQRLLVVSDAFRDGIDAQIEEGEIEKSVRVFVVMTTVDGSRNYIV